VSQPRVVVLGGSGLVGSSLVERWADRAEILAPSHTELDVLDPRALDTYLAASHADSVVNLVAWANVDGAESELGNIDGTVHRLNVDLPRRLAEQCRRLGTYLVHISTDYVFDGTKSTAPYAEDDATRALCWYAETKLRGEQAVLGTDPTACVTRIEMPFTGRDHPKRDLARTIVARLELGQTIQGVTDQRITPVFLDDAAEGLWQIQNARFAGVIHVAAATWTTPFELARQVARRRGLPEALIVPDTFERFSSTRPAARPQHSWLDVGRFTHLFGDGTLRSVEDQLEAWTRQSNNGTR
jgi:dTDP-4-dehydrorhamnose reductase